VLSAACSLARAARLRACALLIVVFAWSGGAGAIGGGAAIVRRAASIPEQAQGLEGFVNASNALITPSLVAAAALTPLGCIVGAVAVGFGSRRGMQIIGFSLGALVFIGSVKGIVA
jgi:hypothetical protein